MLKIIPLVLLASLFIGGCTSDPLREADVSDVTITQRKVFNLWNTF